MYQFGSSPFLRALHYSKSMNTLWKPVVFNDLAGWFFYVDVFVIVSRKQYSPRAVPTVVPGESCFVKHWIPLSAKIVPLLAKKHRTHKTFFPACTLYNPPFKVCFHISENSASNIERTQWYNFGVVQFSPFLWYVFPKKLNFYSL